MNHFKFFNIITSTVICISFLTGCNDTEISNSTRVVESFHIQFNQKDFGYIHKNLISEQFKNSMTNTDYYALMEKNNSVLGDYKYGRLIKTDKVQVLIGENKINLTYHSTYTNYELNELFVLKLEGGKEKIDQIVYDDIRSIKLNQ